MTAKQPVPTVRLIDQRGVTVTVAAEDADARIAGGYLPADGQERASVEGYAGNTVPELRDEIDRRNEGRDEADLIPSDGRKAVLVAALDADDVDNGDADAPFTDL